MGVTLNSRLFWLLSLRLAINMGEIHRASKVRAPIAVTPQQLNHRVSAVITRPSTVGCRVICDPSLAAIGTLEEAIVASAIIPISTR